MAFGPDGPRLDGPRLDGLELDGLELGRADAASIRGGVARSQAESTVIMKQTPNAMCFLAMLCIGLIFLTIQTDNTKDVQELRLLTGNVAIS